MATKIRIVGKCSYCNDPIYSFQEITKDAEGKKYHEGCFQMKDNTDKEED